MVRLVVTAGFCALLHRAVWQLVIRLQMCNTVWDQYVVADPVPIPHFQFRFATSFLLVVRFTYSCMLMMYY